MKHIDHTIIRIERVASTNDYACRQAAQGRTKEGTVFLAYNQTAGKGQMNNRWESEPGKNLTFSILLYPDFLAIRKQFMLSKAMSLGIAAFLKRYIENVKIKWPNDIYIGKRKVCGTLIENAVMNGMISQSVVGIGLNVNQMEFVSGAPNPVSLKMITGKDYHTEEMLRGLLESLDMYYSMLKEQQFDKLDGLFLDNLYRINEVHRYKDEMHEYEGTITGVNDIGQLTVNEKNGPLFQYHFKEVQYL